MKKFKYGYDDLRKILITIGVIAVVSYFVIYVIGHWDIIVTFLQSRSQAGMKVILSQLRSKTLLNFVILILLTAAVTAAIPFMSNAIFAIFNGVVYGPGIGFLMNVFSNILGNFIFIKILKMIDITDSEKRLKNRFAGIDALENTDFGIILGYMIPIVPTILVNYHVAETKLSWRKWLLYITIGVAPSSFVYALGGDAVVAGNLKRIVVLLVIVAVVYLVATYLKRRGKKKA
ncbi:VTT domain-containing protein [Streptococcus macedonicus]|uniref:VTT domain-containing protein n=1 Tax=Streptococcus macedonicus TaxID=59310 RepID=UPI0004D40CE1|nr:VTT domain-containing protein [Streptococcus macedonicus]KEH51837.1 hypothetical protein FD61_07935 [Streptococcus macedonicus]